MSSNAKVPVTSLSPPYVTLYYFYFWGSVRMLGLYCFLCAASGQSIEGIQSHEDPVSNSTLND